MSSLTSRSLILTTATALSFGTASAATIAPATAAPVAGTHATHIEAVQLSAEQTVLDLVRHGQSTVDEVLGTTPPGAPLTDLGEQQAAEVAPKIAVTKGPGSRAAGIAMAYKLIDAAQARWRAVNAPHPVALVRAGAVFHKRKLLERPAGITPEPSTTEAETGGTEFA